MEDHLLKVEKLSFAYGEKPVLRNLNFHMRQGEKLGIAGASGSGKSTLLKLLAGKLPEQQGQVLIKGKSISDLRNELIQAVPGVNLLGQEFNLSPVLSVDENIGRNAHNLSSSALKRFLGRAHNKLSLGPQKLARAKDLSGGQQQRTALAGTLAEKPELLLLDEPFSNLDYPLKHKILDFLISDYRQVSQILVTHEPSDLFHFADRILVLDKGRLVQTGTPYQIYHFPKNEYVARLSGPINILATKLARLFDLPEKKALIRPSHFAISQQGPRFVIEDKHFNGYAQYWRCRSMVETEDSVMVLAPAGDALQTGDVVHLTIKKPSR